MSFAGGDGERVTWQLVLLLADLLVAMRGDEHLHAGLVHVVDVGPVSLDLRVFDPAGQAVDGPGRPGEQK